MDYNRSGPSRRVISTGGGVNDNYYSMDSNVDMSSSGFGETAQNPQSAPSTFNSNPYYTPNDQFYQQPPSAKTPNNNHSTPFNNFYQPTGGVGGPNNPQTFPSTVPDNSNMFVNQQFLMAAGQQLLSNPVTAAAIDAYSQSLVNKSKGWIGNVKVYFAVDTSYVLKKLLLIFLPFLNKEWCIRYNSEVVAPRDEPILPDLYIPSMAFITYILVSGYIIGLQKQFSPEQLGIFASTALAWLLLEVFIVVITKYMLNLSNLLGFFHLIAFGGYKFVCMVVILLSTIVFGKTGFYVLFFYSTFALGYFLLKTLNATLQTTTQAAYTNENPRSAQYLTLLICIFQPFVMYFLTPKFQ